MDDSLLVRFFERLGDLPADPERLVEGKSPSFQARREVLAFDALHDDEVLVIVLFEAVEPGDVGWLSEAEHAGLALEPGEALAVLR